MIENILNKLLSENPLVNIALGAFLLALIIYLFVILIKKLREKPGHTLERHENNPIISPQPHREWEAVATFNPAVVKDDKGDVHMLYRAIGQDGLSRIGYAKSNVADDHNGPNGKLDQRLQYPAFVAQQGTGMPAPNKTDDVGPDSAPEAPTDPAAPREYNPVVYFSGGGWGGSEDPRAVLIDEVVYMTYTAFEGWGSMRMALTSIALEDLKAGRWKWRRPQIISPEGESHKNWVLFPEKINGKYAMLHGITPKIMIEYLDNLDVISKPIKSPRKFGPQPGRKGFFDNKMRGAGPPPLRTDLGWLVLYHANDDKEPHKYKLGAMILDINDPTKILYRSPTPILSPDKHYENEGKPGIVYASGAIIEGGTLIVYYGGGDKFVCKAHTSLKALLDWLVKYGKVKPEATPAVIKHTPIHKAKHTTTRAKK